MGTVTAPVHYVLLVLATEKSKPVTSVLVTETAMSAQSQISAERVTRSCVWTRQLLSSDASRILRSSAEAAGPSLTGCSAEPAECRKTCAVSFRYQTRAYNIREGSAKATALH